MNILLLSPTLGWEGVGYLLSMTTDMTSYPNKTC